jgi:NTE family protein
MIEHLVMSSAGPYGLVQIGMLSEILKEHHKLQSIWGSSAGAILAVLIGLSIPMEDIEDYMIHRPLHKWFVMDISNFMTQKGLVSSDRFIDLLRPFFEAHDVPLTITMQEYYERTNIELHLFATQVTDFVSVDIHHSSFPTMPVLTAVSMSACMPVIFTPVEYEGHLYIDGGTLRHCPVCTKDNTVIISINTNHGTVDVSTAFAYIHHLLLQSLHILSNNVGPMVASRVYTYDVPTTSYTTLWNRVLSEETFRKELIQNGKDHILIQNNAIDKT